MFQRESKWAGSMLALGLAVGVAALTGCVVDVGISADAVALPEPQRDATVTMVPDTPHPARQRDAAVLGPQDAAPAPPDVPAPPDAAPPVPLDAAVPAPTDAAPPVPPDAAVLMPPDAAPPVPPDAGTPVPPDAAPPATPDAAVLPPPDAAPPLEPPPPFAWPSDPLGGGDIRITTEVRADFFNEVPGYQAGLAGETPDNDLSRCICMDDALCFCHPVGVAPGEDNPCGGGPTPQAAPFVEVRHFQPPVAEPGCLDPASHFQGDWVMPAGVFAGDPGAPPLCAACDGCAGAGPAPDVAQDPPAPPSIDCEVDLPAPPRPETLAHLADAFTCVDGRVESVTLSVPWTGPFTFTYDADGYLTRVSWFAADAECDVWWWYDANHRIVAAGADLLTESTWAILTLADDGHVERFVTDRIVGTHQDWGYVDTWAQCGRDPGGSVVAGGYHKEGMGDPGFDASFFSDIWGIAYAADNCGRLTSAKWLRWFVQVDQGETGSSGGVSDAVGEVRSADGHPVCSRRDGTVAQERRLYGPEGETVFGRLTIGGLDADCGPEADWVAPGRFPACWLDDGARQAAHAAFQAPPP